MNPILTYSHAPPINRVLIIQALSEQIKICLTKETEGVGNI